MADIAQRVEFIDRNAPGVPLRVTKRDAKDAFKRVASRPDCASIPPTEEFSGEDLRIPHDIVALWMALPFGRSDSPGYFQSCARLVAKLHCEYQSGPPLLGDIPFCVAYVFVWCDAGRSGISSMVGEIREFFGNTAGDAVLGDGPVSEK